MSVPSKPLANVVDEGGRVVAASTDRSLAVRLLGGLGVAAHDHREFPAALHRQYADVDLVVAPRDGRALSAILLALGYLPNERFNALHGARRMLFYDRQNQRQLDVFVGEFAMCHQLDLRERLDRHPTALDAADLLLTKLQIVQLNRKDALDALRLMLGHEPAAGDERELPDGPGTLSLGRLSAVTRSDWGWYTTFTDNLSAVATVGRQLLDETAAALAIGRIEAILAAVAEAPKSARWKARAIVGRRVPWYQLPEEVAGSGGNT